MAKMKKVKKPQKLQDTAKPKKRKQGHKLVWFTLIIIAIPCIIVGYVLFTSMETQNKPVVGNRFGKNDLNPKITKEDISQVHDQLAAIEWVDGVQVNLKSATLRILVDASDDSDAEYCQVILDQCLERVYAILPMETYFTNTEDAKMYDIEIDVYNYLVDDVHTQDGQAFLMYTKTGAGTAVIDNMNQPRNEEIVSQIKRD